jgi:hypothetical protein
MMGPNRTLRLAQEPVGGSRWRPDKTNRTCVVLSGLEPMKGRGQRVGGGLRFAESRGSRHREDGVAVVHSSILLIKFDDLNSCLIADAPDTWVAEASKSSARRSAA